MTEGADQQTSDLTDSGIPDDEVFEIAPRRVAGLGRTVTDYIVEHPEFCLALAFVVGAAVGVVVKRR